MIYVFCGTGGVGKSTLSSSLALHLGKSKKTILLTIDPSERLKDLVPINYTSQEKFSSPKESPELLAFSLNKKYNFDELLKTYAPEKYVSVSNLPLYQIVSGYLPQSHEYMAVHEIYKLIHQFKPDYFILDTPPGQNLFDFFASSQKMVSFLDDRIQKWFELLHTKNYSLLTSALTKGISIVEKLLGAHLVESMLSLINSFSLIRKQIIEEHHFVTKNLHDPKLSKIFVVTSSEQIYSNHFQDLYDEVQKTAHAVQGIIINRDWSNLESEKYKKLLQNIKLKEEKLKPYHILKIKDSSTPPTEISDLLNLGEILEEGLKI